MLKVDILWSILYDFSFMVTKEVDVVYIQIVWESIMKTQHEDMRVQVLNT